jgi:hypothetical protein
LSHPDGTAGEFRVTPDAVLVNCGAGALAVHEFGLPDYETCVPANALARLGAAGGRFDVA